MIIHRGGRRRVLRPVDREITRVKLVLLALIMTAAAGMLALFLVNGVQESVLTTSLPSYRVLLNTVPVMVISEPPKNMRPEQETFSVMEVEPIFDSVETVAVVMPENQGPEILIYHTHATEAYLQTNQSQYVESGDWRTKDESRNVVAVGTLLAKTLEESYGRAVLHDTTNHEPPKLSTAYARSLEMMRRYQSAYPSLRVYIDVHRDAYSSTDINNNEPKDYVTIDGQQVARIMFVVGTGKGATGAGFSEMPDFEANYGFADDITEALRKKDARLTRDIRIKTGRYNQHLSPRSLLVEVGHNANTLEQALAAVPYLAAAIDQALHEDVIETAAMLSASVWSPS